MRYRVVEVQHVASSPAQLAVWLNQASDEGWELVGADNGFLYLRNDGSRKVVSDEPARSIR